MPRVPSAAAEQIGKLIAAERKRRGLTQDDLASLTGIDSSNIRSYESGRAMLTIHTLIRISDSLRIDPGALLQGLTPDMFPALANDGRRRSA